MSPLAHLRHAAKTLAPALAALTALAGCSAGTINFVNVDSSYDPVQYAQLPYTGPLYAEVAGNPFGIPQADLQRLVNDAIQPPGARSEAGQGVRVHIAFGETASDRNFACTAPGRNTAPAAGGTINMVAALCRGGGTALTYLVGSVDGVQGPSDPRFESFLRQATMKLFPQSDPNRDHEPPCVLPSC